MLSFVKFCLKLISFYGKRKSLAAICNICVEIVLGSPPVKEFWKWSTIAKVMNKSHVYYFLKHSVGPFLGRLPNFGSQPNTMGGKFPSVRPSLRPQKVSSISMKFGIQVVLDERWKKGHMTMPGSKVKVKVRSSWKSEIRPFWTIFKLYLLPIYNGGWQMTTDS